MKMLVLPRDYPAIASADVLHAALEEAFHRTALFTSADETGFHSVLDLDELVEHFEAALKEAGCPAETIGEAVS
jgi:hypothetical protein